MLYFNIKPSAFIKIGPNVHLSSVNDCTYGCPEILFFHYTTTPKLCQNGNFVPTAMQNNWFSESIKLRRFPNSIVTILNTRVSYKFVSRNTCWQFDSIKCPSMVNGKNFIFAPVNVCLFHSFFGLRRFFNWHLTMVVVVWLCDVGHIWPYVVLCIPWPEDLDNSVSQG